MWPLIQETLNKLGITGIESEEHYLEWKKWECPVEVERQIQKEICNQTQEP